MLIATKVRMPMGDGPNDAGLSRHHIIRSAEASLRRLKTDYIDLYQVHEWDGHTPLEETLSALDALVQAGKVRYVGASNYSAWHLMKALWISDRERLSRFVSQQIYYSLQARDAENELVPVSLDQGLGILVWSPIAGGLLSGKYRRGVEAPAGSRHLSDWNEPPVHDEDQLYDTIDVLVKLGEDRGVSAAQVALAYTMAKPGVTSLIVGARTEEQLADNLAAAELALSDEDVVAAGRGQRAAVALPVLAPGQDLRRPARARPISACWSATSPDRQMQLELLDAAAELAGRAVVQPALDAPPGLARLRRLFELWLGWAPRSGLPGGCPFVSAAAEFDELVARS